MNIWARIKRALGMRWRQPAACPHPRASWYEPIDHHDTSGDIVCADCGTVLYEGWPSSQWTAAGVHASEGQAR